MFSLFKKEIIQFFGSIAGYIVVIVFLLTTGLFLWVFGGSYNIPDGGYATLSGLFQIAPWIYLFLIPAITMRTFADEKRNGTIELLLTRPLSEMQIILSKFLAALVVVILTLLPTLIYFLSVWWLGNPVGAIDNRGNMGKLYRIILSCRYLSYYRSIYLFAYRQSDHFISSLPFSLFYMVHRI